jgi:hypothetical protein
MMCEVLLPCHMHLMRDLRTRLLDVIAVTDKLGHVFCLPLLHFFLAGLILDD